MTADTPNHSSRSVGVAGRMGAHGGTFPRGETGLGVCTVCTRETGDPGESRKKDMNNHE